MSLTSVCNHKIHCQLLLQTYPWSSPSLSSSSSSSAFVSSSYRRFSFVLFSCLAHSLATWCAKWTFPYRNSYKRLVRKINIFHILNRSKVASNDAKIALIDDVNVIYEWKFLTNNSKFVRAQKVCCKYSMIWFVVKHKNDKWIRTTGKFLANSNNLTCDLNNLRRCRFRPPKSRSLSFNLLDSMAYVLDAVNIGSITSWRFILCSFVVVVGCHRFERRAQRTVMKHSTSIARLGNAPCSAMYRMIQKLVVEAHVSWHSRLLS